MELNDLLGCALQMIARVAMPAEKVYEIINSGKSGRKKKQLKAYNLCDGTKSLTEIAKKAGIKQGNLSRTAKRWIQSGIMFSLREGQETRLLHLYPLPKQEK